MKKIIFITLMIIYIFPITYLHAQDNSISSSKVKRKNVGTMVENYQNAEIYPSSYLLLAQPVINYLQNNLTDQDIYFHVYFASDGQKLDNTKNVSLILMPATYNAGNKQYIHDPNWNTPFSTCLCQLPSTLSDATHIPLYDNLDTYIDRVDVNDGSKNIANQNVTKCTTATVTADAAANMIASFQNKRPNILNSPPVAGDFNSMYTQSFIVYADDLREFINSSPTSSAGEPLSFFQIYLAIDPTQTSVDKLTLVIVGLDADGNHMYKPGGISIGSVNLLTLSHSAFNESMPCPQCNTVQSAFDDLPQLMFKLLKADIK